MCAHVLVSVRTSCVWHSMQLGTERWDCEPEPEVEPGSAWRQLAGCRHSKSAMIWRLQPQMQLDHGFQIKWG